MAFTPPPVESLVEETSLPRRPSQFVPPPPESIQPEPDDLSRVPIPNVGALQLRGVLPMEQRAGQTPTYQEMQGGVIRELPPEGVMSKTRRILAPIIGAPGGEIMAGPAASDIDRRGLLPAVLSPSKRTFPGVTAEDVATGNLKALLPGNLNAAGENPESFYNSTPGYEAPTWAKIAAGAQRAVARTGDVVANPMLSAGFGMLARAPLLSRAASATFGVQMAKDIPEITHSFNEAVKGGDVQGATEALVGGGLGAYFTVKAFQHAANPGIAKESPLVRRILSKNIVETFTPEQLKESFIRVTRGVATPQEVEMFRFINEAFESPKAAIKRGVKVTQSEPAMESKFWRDYLGLEKGSKEISLLNKGEQNANRQQSAVPQTGSDQAKSVQANAARTPGNVRQIAGASGGQAIEAPRPFTPPPPIEVPAEATPLRVFKQASPYWMVTVQSPLKLSEQDTMPGYVQIDDVSGGRNNWSSNPDTLRLDGFDIPTTAELQTLPQGKYTLAQAISKLAEAANPADKAIAEEAPKPKGRKPRKQTASMEFDRLVLENGMQAGWVENPDVLYDPMPDVASGHGTSSIKAKILKSKQMAIARHRAARDIGISPNDVESPQGRGEALAKLKAHVEANYAPVSESKQADEFAKATKSGEIAVPIEDLQVGHTLNVEGETITVTDIDPETYDVTISDGRRFGTQTLKDGTKIYAEEWSNQTTPNRKAKGVKSNEGKEKGKVQEALKPKTGNPNADETGVRIAKNHGFELDQAGDIIAWHGTDRTVKDGWRANKFKGVFFSSSREDAIAYASDAVKRNSQSPDLADVHVYEVRIRPRNLQEWDGGQNSGADALVTSQAAGDLEVRDPSIVRVVRVERPFSKSKLSPEKSGGQSPKPVEKPAIVATPGQKVTVPAGSTVVMDFTTPKKKDAVRNLTKAEQNRFAVLAAKARDARDNAGEPLTGAELREYQDLEKIAGAQDLLVESASANDAAIEGEVKRLRAKAAELDRQAILTHNRANASNVKDVKNNLRKAAYDLDKEATAVRNKADELEATLKRKVGGNDLTLKADEPTVDKTKVETAKEDDLFSPSAKVSFPKFLAQRLLSLPYEAQPSPFGPGNAELRRDVLEAVTGTRPPKSKAGSTAVRDAMARFFGFDPVKMAGIQIDDAIRAKLAEAAGLPDKQGALPSELGFQGPMDDPTQSLGPEYWLDPNGKFHSAVRGHEAKANQILNRDEAGIKPGQNAGIVLIEKGWFRVVKERDANVLHAEGTNLTKSQKASLEMAGIRGDWKVVAYDTTGSYPKQIYTPPAEQGALPRIKRAEKEAMLVGTLDEPQMKLVRRLTAGSGLDAAIKREVGKTGPSSMTPDEFYSLYMAHATNLRESTPPLSSDVIGSGMTGGWVVDTRPTTGWDFSRGNFKPGHQVVIAPDYWIEDKGGRPARISKGFKPRVDEVAILGEDDFTQDGLVDFLKVFKVGSGLANEQASLPDQITPVGQPQPPAVAKTLPELRALVNSPATGLSKEAVTLINAFLDSPLADTLDGLTVKIQDVVETGWDGSYFQGVVELARNADPKAGVHEFLHRAWEVLPADIKAEFERMRVESLKDELAKTDDPTRKQQIQGLIDNPTTGTADFLARGLPRDLYELSRAEELFTHSGSDQFKAKVGSIKEGFWARVKEFLKDFIAALKKAFKFKQSQEDWLRNVLNGNFRITPESGTAYEARQASLGKPDMIAEAERARSEAGLNLTDLEMPKDIQRLAEEQGREGVPTETFNIVNFVAGRQRLDDNFRQAGQRFTQQVFAEIGIPVRSGPSDLSVMADPANPDPVAWAKMIDRLKKELAEQRVEGRADATGGLVNFLDSLILMWQTQRNAFEQMPPEIGRQLFQFAQGERSWRGLLLGAMAHLDNSVVFTGQNVDTLLQRVWSDEFNGAMVSKVMDRVLTEFKDFFTDEELRTIAAESPDLQQTVDEIIKRTRDTNMSDKVYQRASAWLKPKKPKGVRALQADARVKEAVEWLLDAATKAGVTPTKPVSKKMTPQEQLLHLLTPGVAPQIQQSIENAFAEMEWDAAISASKPDDRPAMMEAKLAGEQPDPELVAKGLALPKFAKWVATRDFVTNNLLGYNPVTLKLVQDLVSSDFSGTKFGKPVAKPAVTKIDLVALAKSPDTEVKRVLDAYLADIEANMQMKGAPPELRQRIRRMIYMQVRDQIAARREDFIQSFISPKKSLPLSASVKLRQLINAGISKDMRFQNDKVRQLVKKIAGEYTKDVPFESLATSTRAEKQQWMERKAEEIAVAEKFSQLDEDTRTQLEATVWTYLAERLQAAEEGITRQFLRGNDVKYEREQLTPEQRQSSLDAAKSKIEGLVRAGAFDASMVEAVAGKSSLAKLTPGLPELIKDALNTPFYRQSELGEQFADKLVSEFSIDEAQRDKARLAFNKAFGNKFTTARKKAAEKAYAALTPAERRVMPERSPTWRKILQVVNSDASFATGEALREVAKINGWVVPSDEQITMVKDLAEQVQRLRDLTPEERAAVGNDPKAIAIAEVAKAEATIERRVALKRQIETYWARWTQPITLRTGQGRANAVAAGYEFSAANLLFRGGFLVRQTQDVATQLLLHIPTRSLANAAVQHGGYVQGVSNAEFWSDANNILRGAIATQIQAIRPALREAREALRGTAEVKNVDRLMSGIALFERLDQRAAELDKAGDHAKAFAMRAAGIVKFSYRFASALDNLQGVPQEYQEMWTQAYRALRDNGLNPAEAKKDADTLIGDLKAEFLRAKALARVYLDNTGKPPSKAELDAAAWHVVKGLAYLRMKEAGMPVDDFESRNRMMRSVNAWNEGIASVSSVGGVAANLAKRVGELGKSAAKANPVLLPLAVVPMAFGRFGNAIGTAIDRALTFTPLGFVPGAFGATKDSIDPETGISGSGSPWYRTREDRAQRATEAAIGTVFQAMLVGLVMAGYIVVRNAWPKDKEERDLWERMGWKPGTIAFQSGDGTEVVAPMSVGPFAMLRPGLAASGALKDALNLKAKAQDKLNAEADRLGLPPGNVKPLDLADMMGIAGKTMWASIMGGRTSAGLIGSLTDYGTFNASKTAAATVSPMLPGLPLVQEATRLAGVSLDSNAATFTDFLLPMPTSGARRVNLLGDPAGTPEDMRRIVQTLTGGWSINDSKEAQSQAAYSALFQTGYRPPSINPSKAYSFDNAYRPMTSPELTKYTQLRGQYLKEELADLGENPDERSARAAYQTANSRALSDVGVSVPRKQSQSAPQERSAPSPSLAMPSQPVRAPSFRRVSAGRGRVSRGRRLRSSSRPRRIRPLRPLKLKRQKYAPVRAIRKLRFA